MKTKFAMLVVFILMATTTMFAQNSQRPTATDRAKTALNKIKAPLNLNQSQTDKTDSVFTDFYNAINKLRDNSRASGRGPDQSVYVKLLTDRDKKLKAIFTADQYTKFKNEVEDNLRPQVLTHEGDNY